MPAGRGGGAADLTCSSERLTLLDLQGAPQPCRPPFKEQLIISNARPHAGALPAGDHKLPAEDRVAAALRAGSC